MTDPTGQPARAASQVWPYLSGPQPLVLGHRGGMGDLGENTVAAFEAAVGLGCTHIETDVRTTADGVAVVVHDATLRRVGGGSVAVADVSVADLGTIRVAGASVVPVLAEVLAELPSTRFNIDLKVDAAVPAVLGDVRRTGARDRVCLAAFSDSRIRRVRRLAGPRQATAMARREVAALVALARLRGASRGLQPSLGVRRHARRLLVAALPCHAPCVQVPPSAGGIRVIDREFVDLAHEQGRQVHAWTVNDVAQARRLLALGVDGIVTDELPRMLGLLGRS